MERSAVFESKHPYPTGEDRDTKVTIVGADSFMLVFDRVELSPGDFIEVYMTPGHNSSNRVIERFTSKPLKPTQIKGKECYVYFHSGYPPNNERNYVSCVVL